MRQLLGCECHRQLRDGLFHLRQHRRQAVSHVLEQATHLIRLDVLLGQGLHALQPHDVIGQLCLSVPGQLRLQGIQHLHLLR